VFTTRTVDLATICIDLIAVRVEEETTRICESHRTSTGSRGDSSHVGEDLLHEHSACKCTVLLTSDYMPRFCELGPFSVLISTNIYITNNLQFRD